MSDHMADHIHDGIEQEIPGTVYMIDVNHSVEAKHRGDIVLYPVPSDDPEDPLNWSQKRKWLNSILLQIYTMMITIGSATGYSTYPNIIANTGIPLSTLNSAVGVMFLMYGWGTLLWCPIGIQYGRRGVYIISCLGCMVMCLWAPYTTSSGSWYAHRFFYGLFGAPSEALVEQSIPDIFFTHERGVHISLYMLWLGGFSFLAPIASGYVAENMNWKWCFYFPAIFQACTAILLFFFMDESMYNRNPSQRQSTLNPPVSQSETASDDLFSKEQPPKVLPETSINDTTQNGEMLSVKKTLWSRYRLFRVDEGKRNMLLPMMIRPILFIFEFPIMAMSGFQYGLYLMMFTILNGTWSSIFETDPYHFQTGTGGLLYIGPFIGAVVGSLLCGRFADWYHTRAARRNGGVREPEQRLPLYIFGSLSLAIGNILYGVGASYALHWIVPTIGGSIVCIAGVVCGAIPIAYISESYKNLTGEGMITMTLIRNTMGFVASYIITPWVQAQGYRNTFITVAILGFGLSLTYFAFIWFGKAERKRTTTKYHKYAATAVVQH